ncbi:HEAT-like repeat-containing protein [Desulfomicrobium apsheronum]|uniref:HEAT-like repeat-containing protein n=1 Tax=Desulfomicrobium apsheronum TaxID=52560 RepID=A0A1I3TML8_9BACT|nr:DVU0298 family protein [Desulfomicrobium apsheronum]SFJ71802.1 HEAT-like repeat-containing protein [Desulfomicrobium apsheronum]
MARSREIKRQVLDLLATDGWEAGLGGLAELGQQAVAPLFSALCNPAPLVRWRAVTGFGIVIAALAEKTPEKARVVMRRFIWSLNDESGGIGWGAPEAMAEIMTASPLIASEYHNHLLAYIHEDHCRPDCYLEHAPLRRGAVWGVGRLAQVRPDLAAKAEPDLLCALEDCDTVIRGLAAWACGLLGLTAALPKLKAMSQDQSVLELYRDRELQEVTLAILAAEAVCRITGHVPAQN